MPFLSGFGKRKEIRYGTVFPASNQTDFPKYFEIVADSDIAAELSGGGGIAVTTDDGTTTVPFGLYPSSVPSTGNLKLRALFSPLTAASTGDVMGYLYYDHTQTTTQNKSGTVANGYELFIPMEEDPSGSSPQETDWTSNGNNGTTVGSMTSGDLVTGQVAKGLSLDGSNDGIQKTSATGIPSATSACSLSAWVYIRNYTPSGGSNTAVLDLKASSGRNLTFQQATVSGLYFIATDGVAWSQQVTAADLAALNTWTRVDLTHDGSGNFVYYKNGTANNVFTVSVAAGTIGDVYIGNRQSSAVGYMDAIVDEACISSGVRTADWIAYAYADEATNSDTFTLGPQETAGGDVTVALTGSAATASAGTLAPSTDVALAGSDATASAGMLTPALSVALAGSALAASAGTLAPVAAIALAGSALVSAAGTLTPATTIALAGSVATASAGTITTSGGDSHDVTVALTGSVATALAGTLTASVSFDIFGRFIDVAAADRSVFTVAAADRSIFTLPAHG